MEEPVYLPTAAAFGLNNSQCAEIAKSIRSIHPKYPPVRIPPPIISADLKANLIDASLFLTEMIFSIPTRIFAGNYREFAAMLHMDKYLGELLDLLSTTEWITRAKKFYRPDFLLTTSGLQMVENNIDTPLGGIGICDKVIERFQTMGGITSKYLQEHHLYSTTLSTIWLKTIDSLLCKKKSVSPRQPVFYSAYHSDKVKPEDDFSTGDYNDVIIKHGYQLLAGPISALVIKDNKVFFAGTEIDIIYTDFSFTEFVENNSTRDIIFQLIHADEQGGVLFLSPPANMLFDNKAILAFLTDDQYRQYFSGAEWAKLQRLIPETHIVSEKNRAFCLQHKESLVLKPAFDFGGRNVEFGPGQEASSWENLIDKAINAELPQVVQRIVHDQVQALDEETKRAVHFCLGPLFFDDTFAGCLYRESVELDAKNPIINASRGSMFSSSYFSSKS